MAGVGSTFPTVSTARTRSSCTPGRRSVSSVNSPQPSNAAPSREHSKLTFSSFEWNVKSAMGLTVCARGPESMNVSGGTSTVHSYRAGDWSGTPIGSTAATWNVCSPGTRPVYVTPDKHGVNGPRSIEHSKLAVPCSEKNVNLADVDGLGSGGVSMIVVSGSLTPSGSAIVHSKLAGGSSRRPNLFVDCTSNVWSPSAMCACVNGDVHGASSAPS